MANSRTKPGIIDDDQRDFVSLMLDGTLSLEEAAEIGGFAPSTCRKWWARGHVVRETFEKHRLALALVFDSLVETLKSSKATDWSKEQARAQLLKLMRLDDQGAEQRNKRCDERRRDRELSRRVGRDAQEGRQQPRGAVPALSLVDPAVRGPGGRLRGCRGPTVAPGVIVGRAAHGGVRRVHSDPWDPAVPVRKSAV